ncbi:MAG: molybdate ABC transporter substrate-binding protein [Myxococcota bacterium]|nr:molybdate ABC transporter substrate-binding protein [Myxococcota bacterium]
MTVIKTRALALLALGLLRCAPEIASSVTVFAAASTTNALTEIATGFTKISQIPVRTSFASSSTLAKQIAEGAPADIYISANPKWMDYLVEKRRVLKENRFALLGNRLVLIAPKVSTAHVTIALDSNLAAVLGQDKLAMGDPDHVPAGTYGKQALESLGLWVALAPQVARAWDVRACLALVERAEAPLGIVYATDAAVSDKVRIVSEFPAATHSAITYPAALVATPPSPESHVFIKYLKGVDARAVFEKYGFKVL